MPYTLFSRWQALAMTVLFMSALGACTSQPTHQHEGKPLEMTDPGSFASDAVDVLVFNNAPGGMFVDAKTSGVEVIHHGERTVTNGDVRLDNTPEQWDALGQLVDRKVDPTTQTVTATLEFPQHQFRYRVSATPEDDRLIVRVLLDQPLPQALVGRAGFNLEFLPSAYWDQSFLMDGAPGQMPRSPSNAAGMAVTDDGRVVPQAFATGSHLVLAPANSQRRIEIRETAGFEPLEVFDGRTKAQNGWYVVRNLIPGGQTGEVIRWELNISQTPGWMRAPIIGHSQVGYHPKQPKQAVIETDMKAAAPGTASLLRVHEDGTTETVLSGKPAAWGQYLRYQYWTFDFSQVREPGLYQLRLGDQLTRAFPINERVYADAWQPTLDFFFPVQMDHMLVKEAYRTWHGRSHMDDALQAPPNYEHFDLFAHDANLDTEFAPFEHIPGLNYGGWYDAGDYDIRTQSQYQVVQQLVHVYEEFGLNRDNTTVSQAKKYTQINRPDGVNDLLQQIEHGTLGLLAQHRAIGHAIPGIVAGRLYQYPHLGDGSTKTDNLIYSPELDPHADERRVGKMYQPSTVDPTPAEEVMPERDGKSGRFDDRWAFTSNTTALNYGSAAALAAASRALKDYNPELAQECWATAQSVWRYEAGREPNTYRFGNTTGGLLPEEKLKAAVELLMTTPNAEYVDAIKALLPLVQERMNASNAAMLVQALPHMDTSYRQQLRELAKTFVDSVAESERENPYGVPITRGGWAGNGTVMDFGLTSYWLNKAFPELIKPQWVVRSLDYLYGTHPDSNYSFVSAVGAQSQTNAYGTNRADFSFIPGGIVPGVLVLSPDYPENKSDWPFYWGQNEYVIPMGSRYLFLTHAAHRVLTR